MDMEQRGVTPAVVVAATVAGVLRIMRLDYAWTRPPCITTALVQGHLVAHPCGIRVLRALVRTRGLALLVVHDVAGQGGRLIFRVVPSCIALTLELVPLASMFFGVICL